MNFLIDLFRKAIKGDNFRLSNNPIKYNDQIAQLNAAQPNQSTKLSTNTINKIQKTKTAPVQNTSKGAVLPGS